MASRSKLAIGCTGILVLIIGAGAVGTCNMVQKYGITDDAEEVRARSEQVLAIRFPAPLEPIFSLYTAEEQQDPLVVWAPDSLDESLAVSMLGMRGAGKTVEEALNRIDNITERLVPYQAIAYEGDPMTWTLHGRSLPGHTGTWMRQDTEEEQRTYLVIFDHGDTSVMLAVDAREGEVGPEYLQRLLDSVPEGAAAPGPADGATDGADADGDPLEGVGVPKSGD